MGQIAGTAKSSPEAGDRRVSRSRVMSLRVGISPRCRKELRITKECHADSICCFFAQTTVLGLDGNNASTEKPKPPQTRNEIVKKRHC